MKENTKLVEQKSLLAKLMAAENITVEHKKIPTAAFDVKNRVLYLPILKWKPGSSVYDLFCAHEVGHALWTPEEGWHSSINEKGKGFKSFLNVVEDARIEKKIKRKFAGARKSMIDGYGDLMDNDFFGLRKMGVNANDLGLIDRINLYTKAGTDYGIEFSDEEREWVEKIMRTETFEDVLKLTDELYEYCKENESETDNSYGDFGDEFEDSDEYEEEDDDSEDSEESEEDSENSIENMFGDGSEEEDSEKEGASGSEGEGEESEDSSEDGSGLSQRDAANKELEDKFKDALNEMKKENEEKSENSKSSTGLEGGYGDAFGDREDMSSGPVSLTDENFRENEGEMSDMGEHVSVPVYLTFPKINTGAITVDYKKVHEELNSYYSQQDGASECGNELLKKFKHANDKMVSYMAKEFEMKKAADIHRRAYSSKKGTLDMNKIHAYKYSENLFQQITSLPEGKNHGMVMFIDWSGSMSNYMKDTIEQLVNLTMFCSKVQIPFEVYAFSDHFRNWKDEDNENVYKSWRAESEDDRWKKTPTGEKISDYKKGDMVLGNHFRLVNLFSSRMRTRELTNAYRNALLLAHAFDTRYNYYYSRSYTYYGMPCNFSLGGTPLDDTIIASKSVIEEFKMKTRAQIVNAVFLTDGCSSTNNSYVGSDGTRSHYDYSNMHIDDKTSKVRVYPSDVSGNRRGYYTDMFLLGLKKTSGINLLGFFLTTGGGRRAASNLSGVIGRYPKDSEISEFRKNKFLIEKGTSYDELYIINTKGLEIDEVNHVGEVAVGSSKAEIRKALKKNTKGKLQNRVLLNAFIEKVA